MVTICCRGQNTRQVRPGLGFVNMILSVCGKFCSRIIQLAVRRANVNIENLK